MKINVIGNIQTYTLHVLSSPFTCCVLLWGLYFNPLGILSHRLLTRLSLVLRLNIEAADVSYSVKVILQSILNAYMSKHIASLKYVNFKWEFLLCFSIAQMVVEFHIGIKEYKQQYLLTQSMQFTYYQFHTKVSDIQKMLRYVA